MGQVENRMVTDWQWPEALPEVPRKLNGPGWRNMADGTFVPEKDAFDYAVEHCVRDVLPGLCCLAWEPEFKEMLVEWFYSGNWVKED